MNSEGPVALFLLAYRAILPVGRYVGHGHIYNVTTQSAKRIKYFPSVGKKDHPMTMESYRLTGSPYERGLSHGEQFVAEIENNVDYYLEHFAEHGVSEDVARTHAQKFVEILEENHGAYTEEMEGIADGSGISLEEITLVNIRHTILYSAYPDSRDDTNIDPQNTVDGCTSFGLQPEVTANGHTYIGQNWDWESPIESFVMDVRRDELPDFLALTEAGMVGGKFGFNEHGLGFVVNGLSTPADGEDPYRKPAHVRAREILNANRYDRAIEPVISTKRPTSRNYVIAHAIGELVDIETTPDSFNYLYPENGILTHANHFEDRSDVESRMETEIAHTVCRGMRINRLFNQICHDIDEEDMKRILRDHFGKPASICRHIQPEEDNLAHTNASAIMDLTERRMLITDGPPCETEYAEHQLTEAE